MEAAADALAYLDWLSGQEEDPSKLAVAAVNVQGNYQSYVDVLGVRLDLSGENPPEAAPRAQRRVQEMLSRLKRIQKISRAARLPRRRVRQVVMDHVGILRWDAPWCVLPDKTVQALRAAMEKALGGRRWYASWRHRGAAWNVRPKAWEI